MGCSMTWPSGIETLTASDISAIANLGSISGVDLGNASTINSVLAMDTLGQSAVAGSHTWYYTDVLASPNDSSNLQVGRDYVGNDGHRYIVLDGNANDGYTGVATPGTSTCVAYYPMQTRRRTGRSGRSTGSDHR